MQLPRRNLTSARVKIQAPTKDLINEITGVLSREFVCIIGPILRSDGGGYHTFLNVIEKRREGERWNSSR